jgi:3-oxoacyl-[acyl-carrier protein] reductase
MTSACRRFRGKVALVTGGSRGIGLASARRLVEEGARVCVTARGEDALAEAVAQLGGPGSAIGVAGHIADAGHRRTAVRRTLDAFGRLDVLVNNTAVNPVYGPMLDAEDAVVHKVFDVNVGGSLGWLREAVAAWQGEHGGAVVNISAVAALRPAHGIGLYGASKAAMVHVTAQLAQELAPRVRVNAVAPALVRTSFASRLYEGREAELAGDYALGRLGAAADVAAAVAYLASDDAAWVTGQTVAVDGGLRPGGGGI